MTAYEPDRDGLLALLDGLLVGAGQLMESPGDWAERLGGDEVAGGDADARAGHGRVGQAHGE